MTQFHGDLLQWEHLKPLLWSCNFSQYKTFPEYLSTPVQRRLNRRFLNREDFSIRTESLLGLSESALSL